MPSTRTRAHSHVHVPQRALLHTSLSYPSVPCVSHMPHRGIAHVCITHTRLWLTMNSHMHHVSTDPWHRAHVHTHMLSLTLASCSQPPHLLTYFHGSHYYPKRCLVLSPPTLPCLHPFSPTEHPTGWDPVFTQRPHEANLQAGPSARELLPGRVVISPGSLRACTFPPRALQPLTALTTPGVWLLR